MELVQEYLLKPKVVVPIVVILVCFLLCVLSKKIVHKIFNFKGLKKIDNRKKTIIIICIVILLILSCIFLKKIGLKQKENKFAEELVKFYDENRNPIFEINKIILYSSATAIDKSEEQTMQSVDVHQFTDIAIYINNKKSVKNTEERNTIKEIYIDNIIIEKKELTGNEVLNYKNSFLFGKFIQIAQIQLL